MKIAAPTYDDMVTLLFAYGDPFDASECHAILCAMICCQPGLDSETWARGILNDEIATVLEGAETIDKNSRIDRADQALLQTLFDDSVRQMNDPELGFQLLLPDDKSPLHLRAEALASWCNGFLYGLALGGVKEFNVFSEPVQDFAHDLAEITQLSHDVDDDSEAGESAYFDVYEYVRMGVLMIRGELLQMNNASGSDTDNVVLH